MVLLPFLVFFAVLSPCFSDTMIVGGKSGWQNLSVRNGVTETKGRFGYDAITLATNSQKTDVTTDLLLDFDGENFFDKSGNYTVQSNVMHVTPQAVMGKGAALSRNDGGMILSGKYGSMFGTSGTRGSFTISFWLSPSAASSGEVLFNWRSSRTGYSAITGNSSRSGGIDYSRYARVSQSRQQIDTIDYQQITASFTGGKIEWSFFNVFDGAASSTSAIVNSGDIRISGTSPVVPSRWSYHVISFNEVTGLLEYSVNGNIEALIYVTTNGQGTGRPYQLYFGSPSDIEIAPSYIGRIDDFKIERKPYDVDSGAVTDFAPKIVPPVYKISGGRIETEPLMTSLGTSLNKVTAEMNVPAQTSVRLYVRSGDNYFGWTDAEPAWIPVSSGASISGISGRYFQVAADLFPDGTGQSAPSVTSLTLDYTPPDLPLPPFTVRAFAENGTVTVSWSYSVDSSVGGYYVYYGTRPGEYLGRTAVEGSSPVRTGNTNSLTLTGLQNNTIYYFAVAAWSQYDERITGQLSHEVYARPGVN